ncbi:PREDICTED: N-acetylgalactosaminyltransferase 7-like [Priapulus caudatus]|uniref:Polypeptide N-acetylgalactosaminyltransferase n=1 Tax=Priapulus caudatus TaxID=37621 RepID=A0ABM1ECV8_PRICU|nr:PREDICTED: N-acetylgalactosaminyltransferase 7-like [Priapulus caudatus]
MRIYRRCLLKIGALLALVMLAIPFILLLQDHSNKKPSKKTALKSVDKHLHVISTISNAVLKPGILGNYEPPPVHREPSPGDGGTAVKTDMSSAEVRNGIRQYGFNMVASDKISLNRTVPDTRMDESCEMILMQLCILVYVCSEHLKEKLDDYVKTLGKVRLIRNVKREGLIGSRTIGAKNAVGDVVVFLDAHCEVNFNWLPPLLNRINDDRTIIAVPIVDGIDMDDFHYRPTYSAGTHFIGIFEWGFLYKEMQLPEKIRKQRAHDSMPYKAPTHAGGLLAIDRKYFLEVGGYDPGMMVWGGENFELSFKVWMCGGSVEWVPCSRVGHVYRHFMPYGFGEYASKGPIIDLNYKRVVEVWMEDEYKEAFYARLPYVRKLDEGDISEQLKFKQQYNCKSFKWFMENVASMVLDRFPLQPPNKVWGEFRNVGGQNVCWDTQSAPIGQAIGISACHGFGGNQRYRLNTAGQITTGERCISAQGTSLMYKVCPDGKVDDQWKYDDATKQISHTRYNKCVEAKGNTLVLAPCKQQSTFQQWKITPK